MMTPQDIRQSLRAALIYSFMAHGYDHEQAAELSDIAIAPCAATIELCAHLMAVAVEIQQLNKLTGEKASES